MNIEHIFHLADLHIRTYNRHKEYKEIFTKLLDNMKLIMKDKDPEKFRVVIAGDIVHQKITISSEQIMLTSWLFTELASLCKVIIIAGNHDLLENNKDRLDSITPIIELLKNNNIQYLTKSECIRDSNIVWCTYSIFENNKRPNIDEFKKTCNDKVKYVGLYHAPLAGAKTDTGYEFEYSDNVEIFEGLDIVMCGDVHLRQVIKHETIPVLYSGSLIQQNFGEKINGHGFLVWDVEAGSFSPYDIENKYTMYQFKVSSINDIENDTEKLINV